MHFLRHKLVAGLFILLSLGYLAETLLVKPDPATLSRYHISSHAAYALGLTVAIPYLIIWLIAFIGYIRLRSYQLLIQKSKDGEAFRYITWGILGLALFLPLSSLISSSANNYARRHAAANAIRVANYVDLIILFLAVWAIYVGSRKLLAFVRAKDLIAFSNRRMILNVIFIVFSAMYVLLALHDPSRQVPTKQVPVAGYYEPDWVLVLTIIIPRLITWYLGLHAVFNMYLYRRRVNGTLYRAALKHLAFGTGWAIIAIVALRVLQTLSATLANYSLGALLALIYVLLVFISVGYVYIARGATKLQKLEEI